MRALVQRVSRASVSILDDTPPADPDPQRSIGRGFVILLGVGQDDSETQAQRLWAKISKMRIFDDENGKTNLSLADGGGQVLVVSQFTLYADCRKGNRPSFIRAGKPEHADPLYEYMLKSCAAMLPGVKVERGIFGADMKITLLNDGPFTVILDSEELLKPRH